MFASALGLVPAALLLPSPADLQPDRSISCKTPENAVFGEGRAGETELSASCRTRGNVMGCLPALIGAGRIPLLELGVPKHRSHRLPRALQGREITPTGCHSTLGSTFFFSLFKPKLYLTLLSSISAQLLFSGSPKIHTVGTVLLHI